MNKKIKSLEDKINTKATVLNQANGFDSIKYKEEIKSELSKLIDSKIVEAEINQKQELKTKQSPEIKKEVIIKEEPVKQPEPVNKPQRMYVRTAEYENAFNVEVIVILFPCCINKIEATTTLQPTKLLHIFY